MKLAILMLISSGLFVAGASAQQPIKSKSITRQAEPIEPGKTVTKPPEQKFIPKIYKSEINPAEYKSNDPVKIFKWIANTIESTPGKPDKFSTTDEKIAYAKAVDQKIKDIGQIPVITRCTQKYNADLQQYDVSVTASPIRNYESIKEIDPKSWDIRTLNLSVVNIKNDTYTGQNAYGAETTINRITADHYVLGFPLPRSPAEHFVNASQNSFASSKYEFNSKVMKFKFPMPASEARVNDENIACLFVFTVEPPYIFKYDDRDIPTRSMPFDMVMNYSLIYGSLDKVAVINKIDGTIYSQVQSNP